MFGFDKYTLFYFFIGLSVFLLCQSVFMLVQGPISHRLDINRRMRLILVSDNRDQVFVELMKARGLTETGQYRYPFFKTLNRLILQSGLVLGISILGLIAVVLTLILFAICVFGFALHWTLSLALSIITALYFTYFFLRMKVKRRQEKFTTQLPEAIDVIARSLHAGHPLPVALNLVAREMQDPIGTEFGILVDEMTYGYTLNRALSNLSERVGSEDLNLLLTAVFIQTETGGNLVELLTSLTSLMRERVKMKRKIRTLTSEGRFSSRALSAMPIIMFVMFNVVAPTYYGDIWGDPTAKYALGAGLFWMLVGNYVMHRMVNFKF